MISVTTQWLLALWFPVSVIPYIKSASPSIQNSNGKPSNTTPSHCADSKFVDNTINIKADKVLLSVLVEWWICRCKAFHLNFRIIVMNLQNQYYIKPLPAESLMILEVMSNGRIGCETYQY